MVWTLAIKNMQNQPIRLLATVIGAGVAILLISIQLGLVLGFDRMISTMIDHTRADLWILPKGTEAFDDASVFEENVRYAALAVPGVAAIRPILVGSVGWRKANGEMTSGVVIGINPDSGPLKPWNITDGKTAALQEPDAVFIDASYAGDLGVSRINDTAYIEGHKARVAAFTHGIRSFTTFPYIFTSIAMARVYLNMPDGQVTYLAAALEPGSDAASVQRAIESRTKGVEVLTSRQFRKRNLNYWLMGTGAGVALLAGAVLGLIVGIVIVMQTLFAGITDHMSEFATLRAMGASRSMLRSVVFWQAGFSAVFGSLFALITGWPIVVLSAQSALPIVLPAGAIPLIFVLAMLMCFGAAALIVRKIANVDPLKVLSR